MSGFEWSARCRSCGLVSPRFRPGQRPICNRVNGRIEVRLKGSVDVADASADGRVFVVETFGFPPSRFEPARWCPRCADGEFEGQWSGGHVAQLEAVDQLVAKARSMLPASSHSAVGEARLLGIECADLDRLVTIDFARTPRGAGLEDCWYVEADTEPQRAAVVAGLRDRLAASGFTGIVERVEWSGTYLTMGCEGAGEIV